MSLVVNHNMMATNVANSLNAHYGKLATSTERLSSGLRINSAADDAAGLAIRELMRADIASLQQGARNANDAISLIQTADGALGVIDEKLIRMKELAEQAATGTYDSTQRLMIESEYQQMASEITRIANATDFNGIHLLNGNLSSNKHDGSGLNATGKLKVHFGSGNDSAEDYYYIQIGECTSEGLSIGNASTWGDKQERFISLVIQNIDNELQYLKNQGSDGEAIYNHQMKYAVGAVRETLNLLTYPQSADEFDYIQKLWTPDTGQPSDMKFIEEGKQGINYTLPQVDSFEEYQKLSDRDKERLNYAWGNATIYNLVNGVSLNNEHFGFGDDLLNKVNTATGHYGVLIGIPIMTEGTPEMRQESFDGVMRALSKTQQQTERYNYAGYTVATQEDAQLALQAINDAIVEKDNIRAHLGATQNRLENTITNIVTQAENLQASESRISDVDVATEMTEFVRQQILTQSAVAMLSQANSLPQMAMQLLGG